MEPSLWTGMLACVVSSVAFGTTFVPVKPFDTADGFFVQWVMGCAILLVGLVVNVIEGFPRFYPLAMLGGALWATGNVTAIPIINWIGMALGLLIWGFSNCVFGWASGRFGWFGITPQVPNSDLLNYMGFALALISTIMFAFVKSRTAEEISASRDKLSSSVAETDALLADGEDDVEDAAPSSPRPADGERRSLWDAVFADKKHVAGVVLSLFAGVFYGLCFAPVYVIQANDEDAPRDGLAYVFAHFCGTFAACTLYFVGYCAYKQNRPTMNPRVALPAFVAGLIWAIGQTSWFVANQHLSEAVTFPIITRFPGVIGALWGVLYFKEIRGARNLQLLTWAIAITLIGGVLSGLSKVIDWY